MSTDHNQDTDRANLELVSTEELVCELKRRHDCCVFISLLDMTTEREQLRYTWKGGSTIALGALSRVRRAIHRTIDAK